MSHTLKIQSRWRIPCGAHSRLSGPDVPFSSPFSHNRLRVFFPPRVRVWAGIHGDSMISRIQRAGLSPHPFLYSNLMQQERKKEERCWQASAQLPPSKPEIPLTHRAFVGLMEMHTKKIN